MTVENKFQNISIFDSSEPFDVCIIGSGPSGTILGKSLVERGTRGNFRVRQQPVSLVNRLSIKGPCVLYVYRRYKLSTHSNQIPSGRGKFQFLDGPL